ncbi:uncharacterized protein BKA78DRAFT_307880 [Phyllosticta capitalensis]|uniref:uncharacterized protein n=1 Tax=Phyllosticta capitalensis TaxID=121624 RepID=UPI00312D6F11
MDGGKGGRRVCEVRVCLIQTHSTPGGGGGKLLSIAKRSVWCGRDAAVPLAFCFVLPAYLVACLCEDFFAGAGLIRGVGLEGEARRNGWLAGWPYNGGGGRKEGGR